MKNIARLSREHREAIASYGAKTTWPAGFTVYDRGAPADGIFVVLRGQIVLRTQVGAGRSFVPWVATPGETFGGEGLDHDAHYASQARAEEESVTLHLGTARFSALLREKPSEAFALVRQVIAERTVLLEKFGQHATLTVEQRLVAALLRLAHSHEESGAALPGPAIVSRRLLGELVGATRESISLVLGRLSAEGLIRREGTGLVIKDVARLGHRLEATGRLADVFDSAADDAHASV